MATGYTKDRGALALRLRREGKTREDICAELGLSPKSVGKVSRYISQYCKSLAEELDIEEERGKMLADLDLLIETHLPNVSDPDAMVKHAQTLKSKMLGLDRARPVSKSKGSFTDAIRAAKKRVDDD